MATTGIILVLSGKGTFKISCRKPQKIMNPDTETDWHFYIMIVVSLILFLIMIRIVLDKDEFILKKRTILFLSFTVVVIGMLLGKYGAKAGLP